LNKGWIYTDRIDTRHAGSTVLDFLVTTRDHSSSAKWRERIADRQVEVNGVCAQADTVLYDGQSLTWHRPPWAEPDVPLTFDLLHADEAIVVVVKPSGLPTMPAGGFLDHTLLALVRARYPDAHPMHRLGRFTSGLVVFGREPEATAKLSAAWRDRHVTKIYRALGSGVASANRLDISVAIGPVPHARLGSIHAASPDGRAAHSIASVIERRHDSTLFAVEITTGRPHQIRIHLAAAGHPLVGDPVFGAGGLPKPDAGLPGDGGYFLHAERLGFVHPISSKRVEFVAPPPEELRVSSEA
jgi:23S rRNA pseudouridine1911/1915/1917 synthase